MQTKLPPDLLASSVGKKADKILRSCVHCGFCLATCPTYQLLGNELDSPRGRIYLIKSALEQHETSKNSLQHLDRCLTCRACETTCPSGVEYNQLIDIGRQQLEHQRPVWQKVARYSVRKFLTTPLLVNAIAPLVRQAKVSNPTRPTSTNQSQLLLLSGCVQPALTPKTNDITQKVLAKLGYAVSFTPQQQCCGAIDLHNAGHHDAIDKIKTNIDQWLSLLDSDIETIISTASGCGVMVKDYPTLFDSDDSYYQKAVIIANNTQDIGEFLAKHDLSALNIKPQSISYHAPCTLQHGQNLAGVVEQLLEKIGYVVPTVTDSHLCCGSAGTYSIFQPTLAKQLRNNKIKHLSQSQPDVIVTSNVGCQLHLAQATSIPVKHWIELLDPD